MVGGWVGYVMCSSFLLNATLIIFQALTALYRRQKEFHLWACRAQRRSETVQEIIEKSDQFMSNTPVL